MKPKILLVNPPIYDFAAFDFWLKPYGLLSAAGYLRGRADLALFDYLDRLAPFMAAQEKLRSDRWGRGRFYCEPVRSPPCFQEIPRYFR
ncbi:MAG: B12-binding domain-containing radical SAM protein, partial [Planctomycetota bacterium]